MSSELPAVPRSCQSQPTADQRTTRDTAACSSTAASQRCPAGAGDSCDLQPSWAPRLQGSGLGARITYSSAAHGSLCGSFSIQPASGYGLQSSSASAAPACTWSRYRHGHRYSAAAAPQSHYYSFLPSPPKSPHYSRWRLSSRRCHRQSGMGSWSGCGPTPLSMCSTAGLPWLSCSTRCHTSSWHGSSRSLSMQSSWQLRQPSNISHPPSAARLAGCLLGRPGSLPQGVAHSVRRRRYSFLFCVWKKACKSIDANHVSSPKDR